jgi:predicted nucleic acid-binding protein
MAPRLIYLDTNVWNRLLDQGAPPAELLAELKQRDATLVLSGQTVYELTRTFASLPARGKELFRYIKLYLDEGIVVSYDNMDLLRAEIRALYARAILVVTFFDPVNEALLKDEVTKLADGIVDSRAWTYIAERKEFAKRTREDQNAHFEKRPDMRIKLIAVSVDKLAAWLDEQVTSDVGAAMLTRHLLRIYDSSERGAAISTAQGLLGHPASRIAKALVRADLYSNWRCAHRRSNKKDLVDDMYHVLNAAHCNVYGTAEPKQKEYAGLLLPPDVEIAIYDDNGPVKDWLLSLSSSG